MYLNYAFGEGHYILSLSHSIKDLIDRQSAFVANIREMPEIFQSVTLFWRMNGEAFITIGYCIVITCD